MRRRRRPSVTLTEAQLAPTANQVRFVKSGEGRLYWSARGEYYSSQHNVVNTGTFQLSTVREYYKLTPQQSGDKLGISPRQALRAGAGGRHSRGAHHRRRQRLALPDDRRSDPVRHRVDCARRFVPTRQQPPWWTTRWRSYRELRDDRTTFFNYCFPRGQSEYTYLLKVVNPGLFRVSPTRVEPMYQPQYLSTSDATTVTVK